MTPRIVALMSFYDEPAATIHECVEALAAAGVDHLVAVDGAYAMYPDAKPASPPDQQAAVIVAARKAEMGLSLHVPARAWEGNEVEKRTFMFALGLAHARDGDWFWVQDVDQVVIKAPRLKERLAETRCDVATVTLRDMVAVRAQRADWPPDFLMRSLFRAQPIRVVTNHYTYVTADGRKLWGGHGSIELEPALDMPDVLVEHRPDQRPLERLQAKLRYYTERDETGAELGACMICEDPKRQAVRKVTHDLRVAVVAGKPMAVGSWIECCEKHARQTETRNSMWLRNRGFDPARGKFENRNGNLPNKAVAA